MDFGIVLSTFGYWDLGVGSLWKWGTLGCCYPTLVTIATALRGCEVYMFDFVQDKD